MGQQQGQVLPQPRSPASVSLSHCVTPILTPALLPSHTSPTLGLLVSMLYHRMDAQALGIWQMLEMTTTGSEWVCKEKMSPWVGTTARAPPRPVVVKAVTQASPPGRSSAPGDTPLSQK